MQEEKAKLQEAFDKGFIPKDIETAMQARRQQGRVWIIENDDEDRVGVGYKTIADDGTEQSQIHWYTPDEVQDILKDIA